MSLKLNMTNLHARLVFIFLKVCMYGELPMLFGAKNAETTAFLPCAGEAVACEGVRKTCMCLKSYLCLLRLKF